MFVKESVEDILKPKSLHGKCFYVKSSATGRPEFIIRLIKNAGRITTYDCAVIYNKFMITGPEEFDVIEGDVFTKTYDDLLEFLRYYEFKEMDQTPINDIQKEIDELEDYKKYLQSLL